MGFVGEEQMPKRDPSSIRSSEQKQGSDPPPPPGKAASDAPPIVPPVAIRGFLLHRDFLDRTSQEAMVADLRAVAGEAPFLRPVTAWGKPMSVQMTSAGRLGWVTDRRGYRYEPLHPGTGEAWPAIPDSILAVWRAVSGTGRMPDSCLVNFYGESARMGLHQDKDEGDFRFPVVSLSLGDEALFRMGGTTREERTESVWLRSGDVVVMGGEARLAYHGIDRIRFGSSTLLPQGGRINVTLRCVTSA